jgi:hypothetical protein
MKIAYAVARFIGSVVWTFARVIALLAMIPFYGLALVVCERTATRVEDAIERLFARSHALETIIEGM